MVRLELLARCDSASGGEAVERGASARRAPSASREGSADADGRRGAHIESESWMESAPPELLLALEITPLFVAAAGFSARSNSIACEWRRVTGHSDQVTAPMVAQEHGVQ